MTPGIGDGRIFLERPLTRRYLNFVGRLILHGSSVIHRQGAFALITLGVALTKFNVASRVVHPLIRDQIHRAGVRLLPLIGFLAFALGLVIIGQTVSLLTRVGAQNYIGTVMVTVAVAGAMPSDTVTVRLSLP